MAAGAIYLGTFDSGNILGGISDPVSLSNFGIPFAPTAKIVGILYDIWYNTPGADWATATVQLMHFNGTGPYVFHGDRPPSGSNPGDPVFPHNNNTAVRVVKSTQLYTIVPGQTHTIWGDAVKVIPASTWVKDEFLPIDGSVNFTHFSVSFSSSAYGDYLRGVVGSDFRVDNIRIVYE